MTRIFTTLAAVVTLAMLVTIGFGFWSWSLHKEEYDRVAARPSTGADAATLTAVDPADRQFYKNIFVIHFCLGLFTGIGILLVHSIIFTYFLGTGRWVKEVTLAYDLPDEPLHKTTRELKRKAFPPALFAMLSVMAAAFAGGGRMLQGWPYQIHLLLAIVALLVNLWAYWVEIRSLRANDEILAGVYREVDRVRAERGLPSNAEAQRMEAEQV